MDFGQPLDAVHRVVGTLGCPRGIYRREPYLAGEPALGSVGVVSACGLPVGHDSDCEPSRREAATVCGLRSIDTLLIRYEGEGPECPTCFGLDADAPAMLL